MAIPRSARRAADASRTAELSHLADVARQETGGANYPVRKKGERRRLLPNTEAIQWLEETTETDTEIRPQEQLWEDGKMTDCYVIRALGWAGARFNGMYPRRMFDLYDSEAGGGQIRYSDPCPACYDYSRSWACQEHPETPWDAKQRCWIRPDEPRQEGFQVPGEITEQYARLQGWVPGPAADAAQANEWLNRIQGLNPFTLRLTGYFISADITTELTDETLPDTETSDEDTTP